MSHELARLSSSQIADLAKEHAVVVQPIGSIEQHGPHLPVVTDAYIAESLVRGSVSLLGGRWSRSLDPSHSELWDGRSSIGLCREQ